MNIAICDDEQIYADEIKKARRMLFYAQRGSAQNICVHRRASGCSERSEIRHGLS